MTNYLTKQLKALPNASLILFLMWTFCANAQDQVTQIKGQLKIVAESQHDSLYYELVKLYRGTNKKEARYYTHQTLNAAEKHHHPEFIARACNALAYFDKEDGKLDSAIYYYHYGIKVAQKANLKLRLIYFYTDLGSVFERLDVYDSALAHYIKSLEFAKEERQFLDQAIALNNIGMIYFRLESFNEAISYFEQAIQIKEEKKIGEGIELNRINLALCYNAIGNYSDAISLLTKVLENCADGCEKTEPATIYYALGSNYYKQGKGNIARNYLQRAEDLAIKGSLRDVVATSKVLLGRIELDNKNIPAAEKYLMDAKEIAESISVRRTALDAYDQLSRLYEAQGMLEISLHYKNQYIQGKDDIFNEKLSNNLKKIQLEAARKQSQEIINEKDEQLKRSQTINILTAVITVMILAITVLLYFLFKTNRDAKKSLQKEVDQATISLRKTNESLVQSQREYDSLIYRTSHDIKGPLATLLGLTNIAKIDVGLNPNSAIDYLEKIEITADGLNNVLSGLIRVNEIRNRPLFVSPFKLNDSLTKVLKDFKYLSQYPLIKVSVILNHQEEIKNDKSFVEETLHSVLMNAFKYFNPHASNPQINITVNIINSDLAIDIQDNGYGIEPSVADRIFDLFVVGSERHGTGIGLFLAKSSMERIGGSIRLMKMANPTYFRIQFPLELITPVE